MNAKFPDYIRYPAIFFIAITVLLIGFLFTRNGSEELKHADDSYYAGEQAKEIAARQRNFNLALKYYKSLEATYDPAFGSGKLYFNIANTYYQLREYPWAVLYYYKAMALMPRDNKAERNLKIALDKLSLKEQVDKSVFDRVFFLYHYLSLPERLQLFFVFAFLTFVFASILIWLRSRWIKTLLILCVIMAGIMLISIGYTRYLSPLEGVIVTSTNIYRDAGTQYAKVTEQPIPSGTKVEVKEIIPRNGKWLKILTPDGEFGYIPNNAIVII